MESEDPKLKFEESDNESEIADINNDTDNDSVYEDDADDANSDNESVSSEKDIDINDDVETMTEELNGEVIVGNDEDEDVNDDEDLGDEDEDEDEDEDDDDDDDEKLYLFDEDLKQNMIDSSHTLLKVSNMSEIKTLSVVTRDINNQITDEHHKTIPILTKYEKAKILGVRGGQINNGCKAFVDTTDTDIDGYLIAERELYEKKIPFIIKRPLPSGSNEYWNVNDLELII